MRTTDFSPLYRTIVGFDRLANMMDTASKLESGSGYPPYNIEQTGENEFLIELAVAGFSDAELDIQVQENVLTVVGKRLTETEQSNRAFLHRGIAERSFERRFHLADHVQVRDADLRHGMLAIRLEREVPETKKPRQITINTKTQARLVKSNKADAA